MLSTGFGSEFASRCSDVCTRWLLNTCLPTPNPSPASLAVATCDRLTVVISTSHVWNLLRTPALRIGTHFLLTLKTVVFLFHLLSTTSKPFSPLSTRLAHAARLGLFYKKTRYINSLLLLLSWKDDLLARVKLWVRGSSLYLWLLIAGRRWCSTWWLSDVTVWNLRQIRQLYQTVCWSINQSIRKD